MKKRKTWIWLLSALILFLGFLAFFSARWYIRNFGDQGATAVLFTLLSGMDGMAPAMIQSFIQRPGMMSLLCTGAITLIFWQPGRFQLSLVWKKTGKRIRWSVRPGLFLIGSIAGCLVLLWAAMSTIHLTEWLVALNRQSKIFEEQYVDPKTTQITFPEEKRNLVYIYLESMETLFFSEEQGGGMDQCVIPELYTLAKENTNFSFTDQVGGWPSIVGGTWSAAGLVNQAAGLPLLLPYGEEGMAKVNRVLPGVTTLWDILAQEGYYQMAMMDLDKNFAGTNALLTQHGMDAVKDNHDAVIDGAIPEGYFAFWGMDDRKLYDYARQELSRLGEQDQPFCLTMFTLDTHFPGGYICPLCPNSRAEQYENVYACASAQLGDFVSWLQEQPFYENTTVIITGDHPSMDIKYVQRNNLTDKNRWVYNCILNAPIEAQNSHNRSFTAMDMFPTTLAAIGCQIEGDRLALGINLYSDQPTLAEKIGLDALDRELTGATLPYLYRFLLTDEQNAA